MNHHPPANETLARQLQDALERIRQSGGRGAAHPTEVSLEDQGRRLRCRVGAVDAIGCEVEEIRVDHPPAPPAGVAERARQLAGRVHYLMEPLKLLETDQQAETAVVRSAEPARDGDAREYYEMTVTPESVSLGRFRKEPGQPRQPAAMPLTRQAAQRLAKDLAP